MRKNSFNQYLLLAALSVSTLTASAQQFSSAYFNEGYLYKHEMNPALGNDSTLYVAIPVIGNINVNVMGNFGIGDVIFDNPSYPSSSNKKMTTFMNPYLSVDEALGDLNKGNNKITGDVTVTIASVGFRAWGGYNTISLASRTNFNVSVPYELFEFAKNTGNNFYDIGDISASAQSFVQLAFGHSRQINEKLRVGAKFKLLFGLGRVDLKMTDVTADLANEDQWTIRANAEANVSIKGFTYESKEKEYNDESKGTYDKVDDIDIDGFGLGGMGMAIDLGAEYKINEDWKVSAAILDLGFIHWKNNMTAVNMDDEFIFNGFHDVSASKDRDPDNIMDARIDDYDDQLADFANLTDQGDKGGHTQGITATLNVGAEYNLTVYRPISFGLLSTTRINGRYSWTEGRLSANYAPLKWLDGNVNVAINNYCASTGWMLTIHPKGFNFFIGMDHILGKLSKQGIPLNTNASVSLGFTIAL